MAKITPIVAPTAAPALELLEDSSEVEMRLESSSLTGSVFV